MDEGAIPAPPPGGRAYVVPVVVLLGVSAAAWGLALAYMHGPAVPADNLPFFASLWIVMIAAAMLPAAAPMVGTYATLRRASADVRSAWLGATAFVFGYLTAWGGAGLVAYVLADAACDAGIAARGSQVGERHAAVALLLVAAVYEVTPLKDRVLARCRVPLSFMLTSWRDGPDGALRMGLALGRSCVACCWALIPAAFALGMVGIAWMAAVAALVAIERLGPHRLLATRAIAVALVALAALLL